MNPVWRSAVFVLGLMLMIPASCGKKGPPSFPERKFTLKVENLNAELGRDGMILKGRVKAAMPGSVGLRVYHAWYKPKDRPCDRCPIRFGSYKDMEGKIASDGALICPVSNEPDRGVHYFQIQLIGPDGLMGPPSDIVKLDIE